MKISKLNIESYRHLQNLDFDFTYQTGERKGQPLDKICFIGQSATGKTGLLDLIYEQLEEALKLEVIINESPCGLFGSSISQKLNGEIQFEFNKNIYIRRNEAVSYNGKIYKDKHEGGEYKDLISTNDKATTLYLKANLISKKNIEVFTKNPIDLLEKSSNISAFSLASIRYKKELSVIKYSKTFNDDVDSEIWLSLLNDILNYRKNFTQKMSEFIHKGLLSNRNQLDLEFIKWQKENPNALEIFAEKFNPTLEKLNLEVDLVNTEYSIPIKNKKTDEVIPIQNTSTGTKGLLLSFLPLFKLDTKDAIILIDEPERSLYPDMQMDLMDYYQNLAPDAQFIVATHSPFVAASFEPEERFILYFDEEGKVAVRRGESPIGDDPNDMLHNDFGINYINKYGQEKHQEYIDLKQKIYFEKDDKKKKIIAEKLEKLGEEYNF